MSAGLMFSLGGLGFILLDIVKSKFGSVNFRLGVIVGAVVMIVLSYNVSLIFLRKKVPNYGVTE